MRTVLCLGTQDIRRPRYGGQRSVSGSLRAIARQGVRLIYALPSADIYDEQIEKNLRICGLGGAPKDGAGAVWRALKSGLPYKFAKYHIPELIPAILRLAKHNRFDALLVHGAHIGTLGLSVKHKLNIPAVLREHNIEHQIVNEYSAHLRKPMAYFVAWQARLTRIAEHALWRHYNRVLFISDSDMRTACEQYVSLGSKYTAEHFSCVYDGVDGQAHRTQQCKEERFVISAGLDAIQNRVNIHWFIHEIWPEVFARYPDVRLDVIGVNKKQFLSILHLDQRYLDSHEIHLLGEVPSFQTAVAMRPYFISPTLVGSGYRVKVAEAGIAGSCLFMTHKDEQSLAFLKHGHNCLSFCDASSFCEVYSSVRTNPTRQKQLRHALQNTLQTRMSWQQHGETLLHAMELSST